jgi:putative transposase
MILAYKYRIYPKVGQRRLMKSHLSVLCELYNTLRDLKIGLWKQEHVSLSRTDLRLKALEFRRQNKNLQEIHSQVVQSVATRLARSFKNYFEGRARFPKRKHPKKYLSLTYPQSGFKLCNNKLYLSGIGHVRIFMHRPMEGSQNLGCEV